MKKKTTAELGAKKGDARFTFIANKKQIEKIKAIAYWDRLSIKDVLGNALNEYLTEYENNNGKIKPIPKK